MLQTGILKIKRPKICLPTHQQLFFSKEELLGTSFQPSKLLNHAPALERSLNNKILSAL